MTQGHMRYVVSSLQCVTQKKNNNNKFAICCDQMQEHNAEERKDRIQVSPCVLVNAKVNATQGRTLHCIVNRPLVFLPPRFTVCFSINFSHLCSLSLQVSSLLLHIQPYYIEILLIGLYCFTCKITGFMEVY